MPGSFNLKCTNGKYRINPPTTKMAAYKNSIFGWSMIGPITRYTQHRKKKMGIGSGTYNTRNTKQFYFMKQCLSVFQTLKQKDAVS